jgi:hypothetical protein
LVSSQACAWYCVHTPVDHQQEMMLLSALWIVVSLA